MFRDRGPSGRFGDGRTDIFLSSYTSLVLGPKPDGRVEKGETGTRRWYIASNRVRVGVKFASPLLLVLSVSHHSGQGKQGYEAWTLHVMVGMNYTALMKANSPKHPIESLQFAIKMRLDIYLYKPRHEQMECNAYL